MKAPSPAFSCYPKDVLSDETCEAMTHEEFGMYWRLVMHAWLEGSVPSDPVRLARVLKVNARKFEACWPAIAPAWREHEHEPGRLVQRRLETERTKQQQRSSTQSRNGQKGGRPLKSTQAESDGFSDGNPTGKPEKARAHASSPSPSPSPSARPLKSDPPVGVTVSADADGAPLTAALIQRRDPVREVFDYWAERTNRRNPDLSPERVRLLKVRLAEEQRVNPGMDPVDGLKRAVDGAVGDPYFNGSENGRKLLEFNNVFKHQGRDRIEKLQRLAEEPERAVVSGAAGDTDSVAARLVARLAAERKGSA